VSTKTDLARILLQEERLRFASFNAQTAWEIGSFMRARAVALQASMAFEIYLGDHLLFACALPGATPSNADWIRRKRNTVLRFHRSSYAMGLQLESEKSTLDEKLGLPLRDYSTHGGCFPLLLAGTGCVGTITASGLPQRQDHALVVEAIAAQLGIPLDEVALDS
jgi:uncharacterized protein (UPF0303 family)